MLDESGHELTTVDYASVFQAKAKVRSEKRIGRDVGTSCLQEHYQFIRWEDYVPPFPRLVRSETVTTKPIFASRAYFLDQRG